MRVRAAGSSGVTTVNAVQTTAEGERGGWGRRRRTKRTKGTQREGQAQRDKVEERDEGRLGAGGVEEETEGGQTINEEYRDVAGSD